MTAIRYSYFFLLSRIKTDHNTDSTTEILNIWIDSVKDKYHKIDYDESEVVEGKFEDEKGPAHWSPQRFSHVIGLREEALNYARNIWADYILVSKQILSHT